MVTQEEKSARQQSSLVLWTWPGMSVQHFTAIHQITVKIFQSGPNWWTDWLKSLKPYAAGDAKKKKSISYFLMFDLVLVFVFWHHESVCWHLDDGTQLLTQQPWPLNHPGAAYSMSRAQHPEPDSVSLLLSTEVWYWNPIWSPLMNEVLVLESNMCSVEFVIERGFTINGTAKGINCN